MRDMFQKIYDENHWKSGESISGYGSTMEATTAIRRALPLLLDHYNIESILDIPCGDMNWMSNTVIGTRKYIGADIVPALIEKNRRHLDLAHVEFQVLDATRDPLPKVDLILCRDLLGHFCNHDVKLALNNILASGSRYLLATTFPLHKDTGEIKTGEWRPINLARLWGLPSPLEYLNEQCTAGGGDFSDKSLGLWDLQEVRNGR